MAMCQIAQLLYIYRRYRTNRMLNTLFIRHSALQTITNNSGTFPRKRFILLARNMYNVHCTYCLLQVQLLLGVM